MTGFTNLLRACLPLRFLRDKFGSNLMPLVLCVKAQEEAAEHSRVMELADLGSTDPEEMLGLHNLTRLSSAY